MIFKQSFTTTLQRPRQPALKTYCSCSSSGGGKVLMQAYGETSAAKTIRVAAEVGIQEGWLFNVVYV